MFHMFYYKIMAMRHSFHLYDLTCQLRSVDHYDSFRLLISAKSIGNHLILST